MRQRLPAILARADRYRARLGIVADQPHRRRLGIGQRADLYHVARHRERRTALGRARLRDRRGKLLAIAADDRGTAVDDDLRRRDLRASGVVGIIPLPLGEARGSERVLPPQLIPISDAERQREDIGTIGDRVDRSVRGRTGRTALALEQFDDRRRGCGRACTGARAIAVGGLRNAASRNQDRPRKRGNANPPVDRVRCDKTSHFNPFLCRCRYTSFAAAATSVTRHAAALLRPISSAPNSVADQNRPGEPA